MFDFEKIYSNPSLYGFNNGVDTDYNGNSVCIYYDYNSDDNFLVFNNWHYNPNIEGQQYQKEGIEIQLDTDNRYDQICELKR